MRVLFYKLHGWDERDRDRVQLRCVPCERGMVSTVGAPCVQCPANELPAATGDRCTPCGASEVYDSGSGRCVCSADSYNVTEGVITCVSGD